MKREHVENGVIDYTMLGIEDHGIMSFMIGIDFDGTHQGFGGYCLDEPMKDSSGKFIRRVGTSEGMEAIMRILDAVGVGKWEDLKGKNLRVQRERDGWGARIIAIGHIVKDRWFAIEDVFPKSDKAD